MELNISKINKKLNNLLLEYHTIQSCGSPERPKLIKYYVKLSRYLDGLTSLDKDAQIEIALNEDYQPTFTDVEGLATLMEQVILVHKSLYLRFNLHTKN